MVSPSHSPAPPQFAGGRRFRAHGRLPVTLTATLRGERTSWERTASLVDLSLGGAGVETEEALVVGEHLSIVLATPTMWDPLVVRALVAWSHPPRMTDELDALGRARVLSRAGLAFDYATPDSALALFEMLAALGYD